MDYLGINDFHYYENTYTRDKSRYLVKDLIELAEKETPFDMPIAGIDIGINPWGNLDIKRFAYHIKRMEKCKLKHPIILDDTGYVCDGWHRIAKAILKGEKTIKAVRLKVMPEPIRDE